MKIAVYPGSFDPITNGHIDVLKRALDVFDKVIVLVACNPDKKSRFTAQERVEMIKEATKDMKNVEVDFTEGLTVKYAKEHGSYHLIRGLRAVTDFEYEFQLASAYEFADKEIDIVFFMARGDIAYINSSTVMALHNGGVNIESLVPSAVYKMLNKKGQ